MNENASVELSNSRRLDRRASCQYYYRNI